MPQIDLPESSLKTTRLGAGLKITLVILSILHTNINTVLFTRHLLEFVPARRQSCRSAVSLLYEEMENRNPVSLVASRSSSATTYCRNADVVSGGRLNIAAFIIQLQCRSTLFEIRKYLSQTHSIRRSSTGYRP